MMPWGIARIVGPYIAVIAIVFGVLWLAYDFGKESERARADSEIAELQAQHTITLADIDRTNRTVLQAETARARSAEARRVADMAAIDTQYTEELQNAKARADADIAAVRDGAYRLRDRFTCPSSATGTGGAAGGVGAAAGVGDDATPSGLQTEDAAFLVQLADEADGVVRALSACQAIVRGDRH